MPENNDLRHKELQMHAGLQIDMGIVCNMMQNQMTDWAEVAEGLVGHGQIKWGSTVFHPHNNNRTSGILDTLSCRCCFAIMHKELE